MLNIYTENRAYAKPFKTEFGYPDGGGGGVDLLHKVDVAGLGHTQAGRAGDDQFDLLAPEAVLDGVEGLAGPLAGLGVVPLIRTEEQFVGFIQHHDLDGGGADINADAQAHSRNLLHDPGAGQAPLRKYEINVTYIIVQNFSFYNP